MKQKREISIRYNMAFGLIPVLACMILSLFMKNGYALYLSIAAGILYAIINLFAFPRRIYNFILYAGTLGLLLQALSIFSPFPMFPLGGLIFPVGGLPFTLEIVTFILTGLLFFGQSILKKMFKKDYPAQKYSLIEQDLELSLVSARIILIAGMIHLIGISLLLLFSIPLSFTFERILFQYSPPLLFLLCMVLNQAGIRYTNRYLEKEKNIPIVNKQGDVIGKQSEAETQIRSEQIIPEIRIALVCKGMLFLVKKKCTCTTDDSKTDIPLESYLRYGESLEDGVKRMLDRAYPQGTSLTPRFSVKHYYHKNHCNRLVYLYLAYADDEAVLPSSTFKNAKLWTLKQIEQNLGTGYFCDCFEEEFVHLQSAIAIWEEFN